MEKFGEKLRTLREERKLTTRQLGEMLGVSHSYVIKMEKGKKIPNAEMILKIADLFEVCIDRLMRDNLELTEE